MKNHAKNARLLAEGGNLYLVGMMGAGKTTVGRKLASYLGRPFIDLDQEIEKSTGVSIPMIFEIEGEAGFRLREAQALESCAAKRNLIVATGGGIVLHPMNRARLRASGVVVYLTAPPGVLHARTAGDKSRPLLQVADPLARIARLCAWRDPLYREIADIVVEAGSGVRNTVNSILEALRA
ncbi:MAG: shikimate kinase [Rhodocyclaceae bacterium]|nr:shikimate kinase [Rhodocyclaceae bacterium]